MDTRSEVLMKRESKRNLLDLVGGLRTTVNSCETVDLEGPHEETFHDINLRTRIGTIDIGFSSTGPRRAIFVVGKVHGRGIKTIQRQKGERCRSKWNLEDEGYQRNVWSLTLRP